MCWADSETFRKEGEKVLEAPQHAHTVGNVRIRAKMDNVWELGGVLADEFHRTTITDQGPEGQGVGGELAGGSGEAVENGTNQRHHACIRSPIGKFRKKRKVRDYWLVGLYDHADSQVEAPLTRSGSTASLGWSETALQEELESTFHGVRTARRQGCRRQDSGRDLQWTDTIAQKFQHMRVVVQTWQKRSGRLDWIQHVTDLADEFGSNCVLLLQEVDVDFIHKRNDGVTVEM